MKNQTSNTGSRGGLQYLIRKNVEEYNQLPFWKTTRAGIIILLGAILLISCVLGILMGSYHALLGSILYVPLLWLVGRGKAIWPSYVLLTLFTLERILLLPWLPVTSLVSFAVWTLVVFYLLGVNIAVEYYRKKITANGMNVGRSHLWPWRPAVTHANPRARSSLYWVNIGIFVCLAAIIMLTPAFQLKGSSQFLAGWQIASSPFIGIILLYNAACGVATWMLRHRPIGQAIQQSLFGIVYPALFMAVCAIFLESSADDTDPDIAVVALVMLLFVLFITSLALLIWGMWGIFEKNAGRNRRIAEKGEKNNPFKV
jgi:hypothetical protein